MSDLAKNQSSFGRPEEDGLRPYSEMLPNWNELSDGDRAMLNDMDRKSPILARIREKLKAEQRVQN